MSTGGIRAGTLNRKIEFFREVKTEDPDSGQEVRSFDFDFAAMADPRPVRGHERSQYGREEIAVRLVNFRVFYKETISATHKIRFNGEFYDIQSIAPMGSLNRRFVEILGEIIDASSIVV
jgi:SPP1 family predicted phage head-tail adaptor